MSEPTKAELLAVVCELQSTIHSLHGEYSNDVSPNRSGAMSALQEHGSSIAQNQINRFPYSALEKAIARFPQPKIDVHSLRLQNTKGRSDA